MGTRRPKAAEWPRKAELLKCACQGGFPASAWIEILIRGPSPLPWDRANAAPADSGCAIPLVALPSHFSAGRLDSAPALSSGLALLCVECEHRLRPASPCVSRRPDWIRDHGASEALVEGWLMSNNPHARHGSDGAGKLQLQAPTSAADDSPHNTPPGQPALHEVLADAYPNEGPRPGRAIGRLPRQKEKKTTPQARLHIKAPAGPMQPEPILRPSRHLALAGDPLDQLRPLGTPQRRGGGAGPLRKPEPLDPGTSAPERARRKAARCCPCPPTCSGCSTIHPRS